jgi:hypothetical protein
MKKYILWGSSATVVLDVYKAKKIEGQKWFLTYSKKDCFSIFSDFPTEGEYWNKIICYPHSKKGPQTWIQADVLKYLNIYVPSFPVPS